MEKTQELIYASKTKEQESSGRMGQDHSRQRFGKDLSA
jgi:hypothetical protein